MTITWEQAMAAIGLGSTVGSAIFWGSLLLGRLLNRVERTEQRLVDIDEWRHGRVEIRLEDHGRQLYELRGERRQS